MESATRESGCARRALSYAAFAPFHDYAIPVGGVYTTTSRPREVANLIQHVLVETEWEIPKDLWLRSLQSIVVDALVARSTSDGLADALARAYLLMGDVKAVDDDANRLRRVTPEAW